MISSRINSFDFLGKAYLRTTPLLRYGLLISYSLYCFHNVLYLASTLVILI